MNAAVTAIAATAPSTPSSAITHAPTEAKLAAPTSKRRTLGISHTEGDGGRFRLLPRNDIVKPLASVSVVEPD